MKRIIKILLVVLIILFIAFQFIPTVHNQSKQVALADIASVYELPGNVQAVFKRSCYDCHSDYTNYPWYAHIQPIRYMLDRHVIAGKKDLNFNEFGTYSSRKRRNKLRAISNSLSDGTMPLSSYLFLHHNARLSQLDTTAIQNWVRKITTNE